MVILGDFNMPAFNDPTSMDSRTRATCNFFASADLQQVNTITNNMSRLLDLVAVSSTLQAEVTRDIVPLLPEDKLHPALKVCVKMKNSKQHNFPMKDLGSVLISEKQTLEKCMRIFWT